MTDSTLDRYMPQGRPRKGDDSRNVLDEQSPADVPESFGAFGWLRGIRDRAVSVELRKKNGDILAIGCGWIESAEYNASEGVTLRAAGRTIRIKGQRLNAEVRPGVRLFEGLARQRVPWIQEADEPSSMEADDSMTIIDRIEW